MRGVPLALFIIVGAAAYDPPPPHPFTFTDTSSPEAREWLEENAKKPGVVRQPSGLQYKVIKAGDPGGRPPSYLTYCTVDITATLVDGVTEVVSTHGVGSVIKAGHSMLTAIIPERITPRGDLGTAGREEAMLMMRAGDIWEIYIPSELGCTPCLERKPHAGSSQR